nr:RHS repeat-associated core domain-containing protein [uncultured Holophaga sp.]
MLPGQICDGLLSSLGFPQHSHDLLVCQLLGSHQGAPLSGWTLTFPLALRFGGRPLLFYTRDHLGSIRELTDNTQTVRARYDYDPYGRMTKISGDKDSAFTYTGHFWHAQSGLNLALFRAYDSNCARWVNRDPLAEFGGLNNYNYINNNAVNDVDDLGLCYNSSGEVWQCKLRFLAALDSRIKAIDQLEDMLRAEYLNKIKLINEQVDIMNHPVTGWDASKSRSVNAINAAFDVLDEVANDYAGERMRQNAYSRLVRQLVMLQKMRQQAWDEYKEKIKTCKMCEKCS